MIASKPEIQIEIQRVVEAFNSLAPDELITYTELSQLVGYDIKARGHSYVLMRAKQKFEKEYGLRLETVYGEGIRKLSAVNLPGIGMVARKRIGRIAKKDHARLSGLKYNDIDPRLRARLDAEQSLLGAISTVASTKGDTIAAYTKTGPMVAAQIFDHLRPVQTTKETE